MAGRGETLNPKSLKPVFPMEGPTPTADPPSCHRTLHSLTRGLCRDVFNEKPSADLMEADGDLAEDNPDALPRGAVIHTTRGDISVKLFPDECPQTVENFATHARNGYYDHVIFHRVIKGFCIQTGDPLGMHIVHCVIDSSIFTLSSTLSG